jgi:hypothetical protein
MTNKTEQKNNKVQTKREYNKFIKDVLSKEYDFTEIALKELKE